MSDLIQPAQRAVHLPGALPFWGSLAVVVVAILATVQDGWWLLTLPLLTTVLFTVLDSVSGLNPENANPETPDQSLFWYRLITIVWFPI